MKIRVSLEKIIFKFPYCHYKKDKIYPNFYNVNREKLI